MSRGPRFVPYDKGRFQLTLGIKAIAARDWIDPDTDYDAHMAEKARLLAERHAEVFAALPESREAQAECLAVLQRHLAVFHADLTGDLGADGSGLAPLDQAGRLVQEDLCLMAPSPKGHRLVAASLCFPARWRLAEKLGRPMAAIHDPVPGFNDKLARPVERFFTGIGSDQLYARFNWSVVDDPALFQPTGHGRTGSDASFTPATIPERLFVRIERQTFRRLPESGALVFGIKTVVDPIAVLADRPDLAAGLLGSVRTMPAEMGSYKSLPPFAAALEAWLEEVAGR